MDVHFRQLYDADGIGKDGLSLSVLVACSINLQFGSLGKLLVVIFEKSYKEFYRFVALVFDARSNDAGGITIQYKGLQTYKFWCKTIDGGIRAILKEDGTFLKTLNCEF